MDTNNTYRQIGGSSLLPNSAAASLPEMAAKRHKIQMVTFVLFVVVYEGHEGIPEYQNWRSVLVSHIVEGSPSGFVPFRAHSWFVFIDDRLFWREWSAAPGGGDRTKITQSFCGSAGRQPGRSSAHRPGRPEGDALCPLAREDPPASGRKTTAGHVRSYRR